MYLRDCLRICLVYVMMGHYFPMLGQAPEPYRIAILGCHRQFEPAPALVRYVESQPDLCLWIGDNIYADTQTDLDHLRHCYDALAQKPAFQQLMDAAPYLATWDDHDFGDNDEWKDYPLKKESKKLFREFWKLEQKIPAEQSGIYYTEMIEIGEKQLQIIMLDVRYHRDEPGPEADMLGEEQWAWLGVQLSKEADVRLLVSGTQVLLEKEAGSETWDEYPIARKRLFDLIRTSQAEGVIFITGDQHYGEVCRMPGALDYDAVELQFSGINQIEDPEFNPLRVASTSRSLHSYALLDVYMNTSAFDVPHLSFRIFDALTNQMELSYRVNLSELFLNLDFEKDTVFANRHTVSLAHHYPQLEVRYTLDGTTPTSSSLPYSREIRIDESTKVQARFFDLQGNPRSRTSSQFYKKLLPLPAVNPTSLETGLRYQYFEGDFTVLPSFENLKLVREGVAADFQVGKLGREDHFAVAYTGYFQAAQSGVYTFDLISDDGSALYLHDRQVINNDGSHSRRSRQGKIALSKGFHPIRIEYFEDYDGESLEVHIQGPGLNLQPIPFDLLFHP